MGSMFLKRLYEVLGFGSGIGMQGRMNVIIESAWTLIRPRRPTTCNLACTAVICMRTVATAFTSKHPTKAPALGQTNSSVETADILD